MKLASMKLGNDEYRGVDRNPYGYGLTIELDDDRCEALGIKGPIKPGTVIGLQALAVVTRSVEMLESADDVAEGETSNDVCLSLQITDLGLSMEGQGTKTATILYGDD
jgi:hypothetical protein